MTKTCLGAPMGAFAYCAILVGCATPQTEALQQAEAKFQQAQSDPSIQENAPVELREARQTLEQAKSAGGREEVNHLSFVAEQKVELAEAVAAQRVAEQQIEALSGEREKILLQSREAEAEQAQSRADALAQELAALKAEQTERGTLVTLSDVLFATDEAELKPGALRSLEPLAEYLRDNPERGVLIEGHTDSVGSATYNQQLSLARADAVRSYLIQQGIDGDRITARGLGEAYPVVNNDTAAGRQQNRRVDVVIEPAS